MKKAFFCIILMGAMLLSTFSTAFAEDLGYVDNIPQDSHKVLKKWDFVGTFVSTRDLPGRIGSTWSYDIHIKQAVYGPYSKGVIVLTSGDHVITAHVVDVKEDFGYWQGYSALADNVAAVGWAEYNGAIYNFMFLCADGGIWIILSTYSYEAKWAAGTVWTTPAERAYQVLSPFSHTIEYYDIDPKFFHE